MITQFDFILVVFLDALDPIIRFCATYDDAYSSAVSMCNEHFDNFVSYSIYEFKEGDNL